MQRLSVAGRLAHGAHLISISGPLPWGEYLPLKKRVFETPITVSCTNKPLEIALPKNQQNEPGRSQSPCAERYATAIFWTTILISDGSASDSTPTT
jgi:hypothetical protein